MKFAAAAVSAICAAAGLSTSAVAVPVIARSYPNSTETTTTLSTSTVAAPGATSTGADYPSGYASLCPVPFANWDVSKGRAEYEPAVAQVYRTNGQDVTHVASFEITADLAAYQCDLVLDLGETGDYANSPMYQVWTSSQPITRESQSNHRDQPYAALYVQKPGRSLIKSFPCSKYAGGSRLNVEISPLSDGQGMFWSTNEYGLRVLAH